MRAVPLDRLESALSFRVLVVDDDHDAADSLRLLLEWHGFEVEVAYSGSSGLEAAQAFAPHAILCDLAMPGLDGNAVAREARRDPCLQQILLVALSGFAADADRRAALDAGFDLHFGKPVDPAEFPWFLRTYLRRAQSRARRPAVSASC